MVFECKQKLNKAMEYLWKAKDLADRPVLSEEEDTLIIGYVTKAESILFDIREEISEED